MGLGTDRLEIVIAWAPGPDEVARIETAAQGARVTVRPSASAAEVSAALDRSTDVVFTDLLPDRLEPGARLRWAQVASAGIEVLRDSPLWSTPGVTITNASGIHAPIMSEYIIASILSWSQQLDAARAFKRTRRWGDRLAIRRAPVAEQTLGIIGYGSIGRRAARLAQALGMRVLAIRQNAERSVEEQFRWPFVRRIDTAPDGVTVLPSDELPRLLRSSDFLAITAPFTPRTAGLIGARELALMKPTAYIVNVSRGRIFDEPALVEALRERRIAGAALDVFAQEPPDGSNPLFGLENAEMTPHISGVFDRYNSVATDVFIENLDRFRRKAPLLNVVTAERGY